MRKRDGGVRGEGGSYTVFPQHPNWIECNNALTIQYQNGKYSLSLTPTHSTVEMRKEEEVEMGGGGVVSVQITVMIFKKGVWWWWGGGVNMLRDHREREKKGKMPHPQQCVAWLPSGKEASGNWLP